MWQRYYFKLFRARLFVIQKELERIRSKYPERLRNHPTVALYVSLVAVMAMIEENPANKIFELGNTLGKKHRGWRRAKDSLPDRYRLFFKFFSAHSEIFFVWLNDENTLRKKGAKTDCYAVFKRMLESGKIPQSRAGLLAGSTAVPPKNK